MNKVRLYIQLLFHLLSLFIASQPSYRSYSSVYSSFRNDRQQECRGKCPSTPVGIKRALLKYKMPEIARNSWDQQSLETQPEVMSQSHRRPKLQWLSSSLDLFIDAVFHELHLDDAPYMPTNFSFCSISGWSSEIPHTPPDISPLFQWGHTSCPENESVSRNLLVLDLLT